MNNVTPFPVASNDGREAPQDDVTGGPVPPEPVPYDTVAGSEEQEREFKPEGSNLYQHAMRELKHFGMDPDGDSEDMNTWMAKDILALIALFASQGHSGSSASYCLGAFRKLAAFEPLGPLTGEDNEWAEVAVTEGKSIFQNKRCGHVFKVDGVARDSQGTIFREPNGAMFTSSNSHVVVTFPYTPKSEIVDVDEKGKPLSSLQRFFRSKRK